MAKKKKSKNLGPVKLKQSRVVRPTYDKNPDKEKRKPKDTTGLRYTKRTKEGVTIPRAIQLYRYWFLYLKLALELEALDYVFRETKREKIKEKKKMGDKEGSRVIDTPLLEPVVVNRRRYEEWDLISVRDDKFDVWWKTHKSLFIEDPTVELFLDKKDIGSQIRHIQGATQYRYFRSDSRKSVTDTLNEIRHFLVKDRKRRTVTKSRWTIEGEMREEALFNRYNALIMNIEGMKSPDILKSRMFRRSRRSEVTRSHDSQLNSQRMRDLLQPAKRIVLSVSDGYFMKSPKWDDYFNRKRKGK